ncbi:MAG: Gfo/Idh/MocA family oxidoreductase [Lachnospiraceae bacterium]|nr:Gfo/Idh/MocA family oxidoreductase [Lachnospiraceae bacterium]
METGKMHVGVIGAGAISDIYLKNMTEVFDQLEVIGVAANHIESAQKKAAQYQIKAYTVDEMLADPAIEMVVVLTPVGTHYDLIRRALFAGKHVYTEKTITDDPEKAKELLELADEKGLGLASAPDTFLGSALQTARRAIDNGLIGDIHSFVISGNRKNDILLSIFAFLRQPGAGILYDYAVYYMTALVSLLGPVKRVAGVIGRPYPTHLNIMPQSPDFGKVMDTPNESQVSAILQLENGVTGTLHIDADSNLSDTAFFALYGTKGILYLTDANQFGGTVKYLPDSVDYRKPAQPVELWSYTPFSGNSRGVGPADLADAVMEKRPCRASKEMAYHVLEVLTGILNGGENGAFTDILSTCEKPAPLPVRSIGARNIGHASFNMKNVDAMKAFYKNALGMKEHFTLTFGDLAAAIRRSLEAADRGEKTLSDSEARERALMEERVRGMEARKEEKWLTYFKLADGQFMELFYPNSSMVRSIENRKENYGYFKRNYEVRSIEELRARLLENGVSIDEDIHTTIDGAREIMVHDPDGNEVQFTEYPKGEAARISMPEIPEGHSISFVEYTTQVAYQVKDAVNMENFYCLGLGLKKVFTLHYTDLLAAMEASGKADPQMLMGMRMMGDRAWIDYIEVAPHQYIELFHTDGQELKEDRDLADSFGYQHLCIEVEDIEAAWKAVTENGLTPEGKPRRGVDGSWQFWLVDPDGNRLELMQYTENSRQLG